MPTKRNATPVSAAIDATGTVAPVDTHPLTQLRRVAVEAGVDERTAREAILAVDFESNLPRRRVGDALDKLNYDHAKIAAAVRARRDG